MEKESRLAVLLSKLLENSCTPAEADELIGLMSTGDQDPQTLQLVYENISAPGLSDAVSRPVRQGLQEKLELILSIDPSHTGAAPYIAPLNRIRPVSFRKYAAILLLLICAAGGGLFLLKTRKTASPVLASPPSMPNDLAPGYSKAILTLANGEKILLDSAGNGILAQQGNTHIVKQDGGHLRYDTSVDQEGKEEKNSETVYNTLTTPAGGQYRLTLPDGSKVWLDAASSITYPTAFSGAERSVVVSGQVYIEAEKNEKQPFIVHSGELIVKVLGTGFNINAYPNEPAVKTTLVEGSIKVIAGGAELALDPGQQAQWRSVKGMKLVQADIAETVAWKNGFFSFRHADMQTLMRQLSRWYDVKVQYEGSGGREETFSGEIGRDLTLTEVLDGLQLNRVRYRILADKKLVIIQ